MIGPFVLGGAGMALVFAPSANAVLASVRADQAGQASGATNAIRELGGVLGVSVLATVFTSHGGYGSPQAFVDGLVPALWIGTAVLAVGRADPTAAAVQHAGVGGGAAGHRGRGVRRAEAAGPPVAGDGLRVA